MRKCPIRHGRTHDLVDALIEAIVQEEKIGRDSTDPRFVLEEEQGKWSWVLDGHVEEKASCGH